MGNGVLTSYSYGMGNSFACESPPIHAERRADNRSRLAAIGYAPGTPGVAGHPIAHKVRSYVRASLEP